MKIQITGYSSSGKSTFAKKIANHFELPLLHIDKIYFQKNWEKRNKAVVEQEIKSFISQESWIIDGQYRYLANERYDLSDLLFVFDFNRFKCLYGAIKRRIKFRNKQRDSIAKGCKERLNLSFIFWILWQGRKKDSKELIKWFKTAHHDKVVVFKNRKQVNKYLKSINYQGTLNYE